MALSPDARTLATADQDRTARLWDVSNPRQPRELAKLTGNELAVPMVAFSPDGHTVATGGNDHTLRLWETDIGRAAARVCATTHPSLTRTEWKGRSRELGHLAAQREGVAGQEGGRRRVEAIGGQNVRDALCS